MKTAVEMMWVTIREDRDKEAKVSPGLSPVGRQGIIFAHKTCETLAGQGPVCVSKCELGLVTPTGSSVGNQRLMKS
jgi:hypothetical protein